MKSSRSLSLLLAVAASALISAASHVIDAAAHVAHAAVHAIRATADWFGDCAMKVLAGPAPAAEKETTASLRGFVVHKAHQSRQIKRQAPRVEDSWRMCPSI